MYRKSFFFYLLILFLLLIEYSCTRNVNSENLYNDKEFIRVWALADIQPRNSEEREAFSIAVKDVNTNIKNVNFAIVAGDIVHTTEESTFDWYVQEKNKSYITDWYEIIGNHDLKSDRGKLFKEKIRDELNYSITLGNLLFIFLSDDERGKPTEVNDEVFLWWKNLVINNQDKIITVITHAPLQGSKIPFSKHEDRQIVDSDRFRKVLKEYKVDLWLSGHLHLPNEFTNTLNRNPDLNNTIFVHISSIRPEFLGLKHSQSRILDFICDTNLVNIKSRDHEWEKWNTDLEKEFELSKIIKCN